jgi:plasmid stability protein
MQTINLRNVPEDLVRKVKSKAALSGVTMRQFVIDTLTAAVEEEKPTRGKAPRK